MLRSIWEDVKREFGYGNMVTRIIIINIAVFVIIHLIEFILFLVNGFQPSPLYGDVVNFFSMSSDWRHILTHPWVIITSMFLHEGPLHIFGNMLMMYWFGRIAGDFIGNQRILPIYLLGGLAGNLVYFISTNLPLPPFIGDGARYALGASAAVMAMVAAAGTIAPDYILRLLFFGDIKLKFIVFTLILLDLIALSKNNNSGGVLAHLGGVAFGVLFINQLRHGNDWALPVNNLLDRLSDLAASLSGRTRRKGPHVVYRNTSKQPKARTSSRRGNAASDHEDLSHQERLDAILDKIKQSGYDSLSESEKEFLFNASKK